MPYIKPELRQHLDPDIDALAAKIKLLADNDPLAWAGILNYACTRLGIKVLPQRTYGSMALLSGVYDNVNREFYRRVMSPYEEEKIVENGDCY